MIKKAGATLYDSWDSQEIHINLTWLNMKRKRLVAVIERSLTTTTCTKHEKDSTGTDSR